MGPVCPYVLASVARFSGKWKIPVLSTGGQASAFRKKSDYPLLTTMGGNYRMFGVFFAKLLRRYAWEKFAFLPHVYPEISKKGGSSCEFSLNDIWSVYKEGKKTYEQPFYEPLHEDRLNSTEIKALLERVKDKARGKNFLFFEKKNFSSIILSSSACIHLSFEKDKQTDALFIESPLFLGMKLSIFLTSLLYVSVVILCASPSKVREILLAAEGLKMMEKGDYVFFNVELFTK